VSSSPTHREEQYVPLIGDLDVVAWPGTTPTQGPHSLYSQDTSQTTLTHFHPALLT
jgi:hypothetical protein